MVRRKVSHKTHLSEDLDALSAMVALDHVGRDDINCVTVAVDDMRMLVKQSEWKLDQDVRYER